MLGSHIESYRSILDVPTQHAGYNAHSTLQTVHITASAYVCCHGAFGGPSPAGLTACMATPPCQPSPPPSSPDPALIYAPAERAKPDGLQVGVVGATPIERV